jgi:hypothetical protein
MPRLDRATCDRDKEANNGKFFAKYLPPPAVSGLPGQIPESLVPPLPHTLTTDQQFFARAD